MEDDMGRDGSADMERGIQRAREAKRRFEQDLFRRPGVHTVGIGFKRRGGKDTDEIAVVVFVSRKRPPSEVGEQLIPPRLVYFSPRDGDEVVVPTDVREVSPPTRLAHVSDDLTARVRPVPGGYSVGYWGTSAGTLGGWVWDDVIDRIVLLSNEHVIGSGAGTQVVQPGVADGGSAPGDAFAQTLKTAPTYDASVALASNPADVATWIVGSGNAVLELADPVLGMLVEKTGRTTKHTLGRISVIDSTFIPPGGVAGDTFVEPDPAGFNFVQGGDSGSLLLERVHPQERSWKRVVGLIWGGGNTEDGVGAWVHPIKPVFNELDLETICAGLFKELLEGLGDSADSGPGTGGGKGPGGGKSMREGGGIASGSGRARAGESFGRHLERRFRSTPVGALVASALSDHRDAAVEVLLDTDGRRAFQTFVAPFLEESVTTDDVLARTVRDEDVRNAERLLVVVARLRPDKQALVARARGLAKRAAGRSVADFLADYEAAEERNST
jgi:hypothetical protein